MGLLDKISNLLSSKKKDANILVVGLDNSGKSSIINTLKFPESRTVSVNPTLGFSNEKFTVKSLNFNAYDMSGQGRYRNLWEHYYREADGIVYVIDSSDKMRFVVSKDELFSMLNHPDLKTKSIPILFLANKTDVKGACSTNEIKLELELDRISNKTWRVFESNVTNGSGIEAGFEWLAEQIKNSASNN